MPGQNVAPTTSPPSGGDQRPFDWQTAAGVAGAVFAGVAVLWVILFGSRSAREARHERAERKAAARRERAAGAAIAIAATNNLPADPDLVGRDVDVAKCVAAFYQTGTRGVLVKGPAGVGKTAFATRLAHEVRDRSSGRPVGGLAVHYVSAKAGPITLTSFADGLGRALGFPSVASITSTEEKLEELFRITSGVQLLLVLDNVESVSDESLFDELFRLPATCRYILTSRRILDGSPPLQVYELRALRDAAPGELLQREFNRLGLGSVASYNESSIDDLLTSVHGSPLGIKWAAGRLSQGLSVESVVARLTTADGDIFQAMFSDNWTDLSDRARRVLMIVSMLDVSVGHAILVASLGTRSQRESEDAIADVVRVSLLEVSRREDARMVQRYGLHPLARAFAGRKLGEYPNADEVVREPLVEAVIGYFSDRRYMQLGRGEYDSLELELPNVFRLMPWLSEVPEPSEQRTRRVELLTRLADVVNVYLWSRGYWGQRVAICTLASEVAENHGRLNDAGRHAAFVGIVRFWQGDLATAKNWALDSARLMRASGTSLDVALAARLGALIRHREGDTGGAISEMLSVLDTLRETRVELESEREKIRIFADWVCPGVEGYRAGLVSILQEIGIMYADVDDPANAVYWLDKSRALADVIGDTEGAAVALSHKGRALARVDRHAARSDFELALSMARAVGRRSTEARSLLGLAGLRAKAGKAGEAKALAREAADIFRRLGMNKEEREANDLAVRTR